MPGETISDANSAVRNWWNENPYTYGLSQEGHYRDVGDIDDSMISDHFFDEYIRKTRKHIGPTGGRPDEPVAARFIPYRLLEGKKVLDIACGIGWATAEMARAGADVTGIDLTPRAVELANKHLEHRGLSADARAVVMDAQELEFDDDTFDFVHAWGCLMHMPDTERAMQEILRVLKPGGLTRGYMYNKRSISYWWHFWFLRGVLTGAHLRYRGDSTRLASRYVDGASIGGNPLTKVYTPREIRRMFEEAGFEGVDVRPWGPPEMLDSWPVSRFPLGARLPYRTRRWIASYLGWGVLFAATKPLA